MRRDPSCVCCLRDGCRAEPLDAFDLACGPRPIRRAAPADCPRRPRPRPALVTRRITARLPVRAQRRTTASPADTCSLRSPNTDKPRRGSHGVRMVPDRREPRRVTTASYRLDGEGWTFDRPRQVFVLDIESGESRRSSSGRGPRSPKRRCASAPSSGSSTCGCIAARALADPTSTSDRREGDLHEPEV
jgi:hypothetical protein